MNIQSCDGKQYSDECQIAPRANALKIQNKRKGQYFLGSTKILFSNNETYDFSHRIPTQLLYD